MNLALLSTKRKIVLFLDDDIVPAERLADIHATAHGAWDAWAVVGQIIQPWQSPEDVQPLRSSRRLTADLEFPFHSRSGAWVRNVMAGHLSVRRDLALQAGGFDENFQGAAYRFETEFARRLIRAGGRIRFCPEASIRHLRVARGGTRVHGDHLASASPMHGVGDYYFALLSGWTMDAARYMCRRALREVSTKFHLKRPWYIPVKLLGELRAFLWACQLKARGQALLKASDDAPHEDTAHSGAAARQEAPCPSA
jgi:hypothetical protein